MATTELLITDGRGRLAFPGVVDAHQHWGIHSDLGTDTATESRAAAQGEVTIAHTCMRTGQYHLNKGGPYRESFPEVLSLSADKSYVDYGFRLAPITAEHVDEIPMPVRGPK